MPSSNVNIPPALRQCFERWLSAQMPGGKPTIHPLAGDGSARQFFRARCDGATWVLLWEPGWKLSKDYAAHQRVLTKWQIPVPRFEAVFPEEGVLIMEDLGDELLQVRIQRSQDPLPLLSQATELIAHLHGRAFPVPSQLPVAQRRFDAQKYAQELEYTQEHLVRQMLHLKSPASDTSQYCQQLDGLGPQVFCHRDYHTRNILYSQERLILIDFQDARLGSPHYDLASLIYDPYVPTTNTQREKLIAVYRDTLKSYPVSDQVDWGNFEIHLHWVGYQRLVKAAGSFASFFNLQGKATHLPYLLPALRQAQTLATIEKSLADLFDLDLWIDLLEGMEAESL